MFCRISTNHKIQGVCILIPSDNPFLGTCSSCDLHSDWGQVGLRATLALNLTDLTSGCRQRSRKKKAAKADKLTSFSAESVTWGMAQMVTETREIGNITHVMFALKQKSLYLSTQHWCSTTSFIQRSTRIKTQVVSDDCICCFTFR